MPGVRRFSYFLVWGLVCTGVACAPDPAQPSGASPDSLGRRKLPGNGTAGIEGVSGAPGVGGSIADGGAAGISGSSGSSSQGGAGTTGSTGGTSGQGATSGSGGVSGSSGSSAGGSTGATGGTGGSSGSKGDCCTEHLGAGCNDPIVESCVCFNAPSCCSSQWTSSCVESATLDCGYCGGSSGAGGSGGCVVASDCPPGDPCEVIACNAGVCSYTPKTCNDGKGCTNDFCDSGSGACVFMPNCPQDLPPFCDGNTLKKQVNGTCSASGVCTYTTVTLTGCPGGCSNGVCAGDPCFNVVCPVSLDPCKTNVCQQGTCVPVPNPGGNCNDSNSCTVGDTCTNDGSCVGTPKDCSKAPPSECKNGQQTDYFGGTCTNGSCEYLSSNTKCSNGCAADGKVCAGNPCAGVVCGTPPGQCFNATGTCTNANCNYEPLPPSASCDDGDPCTESDACDGAGTCKGSVKECNSPPDAKCQGNTRITYNPSGSCALDGSCTYPEIPQDCPQGCDQGACIGVVDPCTPNPCTAPPSDCYQPIGICTSDGGQASCEYQPKPKDSACNDGLLCTNSGLNDTCDGAGQCTGKPKICDTPQDAFCKDGVVTSFLLQGSCSTDTGSCVYLEFNDPCAFGACDQFPLLCAGDKCTQLNPTCDKPPSTCYESTGVCNIENGRCSYKQLLAGTPCKDLKGCDGVCSNGGFCFADCGQGGQGGEGGEAGQGGEAGTAGQTGGAGEAGTSGQAGAGQGGDPGTSGAGGAGVSGTSGQGGSDAGSAGTGAKGGAPHLPKVAGDKPGTAEVLESVQEGGCGCRTAGTPNGAWWGMALAALPLLRRRRTQK